MRQFFLTYPKGATLSHLLSWSHYVELLKIEDALERDFYLNQAVQENGSIRELKRQKNTNLFLRLAARSESSPSCDSHPGSDSIPPHLSHLLLPSLLSWLPESQKGSPQRPDKSLAPRPSSPRTAKKSRGWACSSSHP